MNINLVNEIKDEMNYLLDEADTKRLEQRVIREFIRDKMFRFIVVDEVVICVEAKNVNVNEATLYMYKIIA